MLKAFLKIFHSSPITQSKYQYFKISDMYFLVLVLQIICDFDTSASKYVCEGYIPKYYFSNITDILRIIYLNIWIISYIFHLVFLLNTQDNVRATVSMGNRLKGFIRCRAFSIFVLLKSRINRDFHLIVTFKCIYMMQHAVLIFQNNYSLRHEKLSNRIVFPFFLFN